MAFYCNVLRLTFNFATTLSPNDASHFRQYSCTCRPRNHMVLNLTKINLSTGRLYQVEYAMEAIGHAGTCLGILANDGVVLAAERRNINKLLDEVANTEKIYKLNK